MVCGRGRLCLTGIRGRDEFYSSSTHCNGVTGLAQSKASKFCVSTPENAIRIALDLGQLSDLVITAVHPGGKLQVISTSSINDTLSLCERVAVGARQVAEFKERDCD